MRRLDELQEARCTVSRPPYALFPTLHGLRGDVEKPGEGGLAEVQDLLPDSLHPLRRIDRRRIWNFYLVYPHFDVLATLVGDRVTQPLGQSLAKTALLHRLRPPSSNLRL